MKKLTILLIFNLSGLLCFTQNAKIDSLLNVLKTVKEDTNKVNTTYLLSLEFYFKGDYEQSKKFANDAIFICNKLISIKNQKSEIIDLKKAKNYIIIGFIYRDQDKYPEALKSYITALNLYKKIGNKKGIANSYMCNGTVYTNQSNYPEALKSFFAALKVQKEISVADPDDLGNKRVSADSYNNIGNIYSYQGNYIEALKNQYDALKIQEEISKAQPDNFGNKQGLAASFNNIGAIYSSQNNYPEALKNYHASLKIEAEIGSKQGMALSYNNIGNVYKHQVNYPNALKNYFVALKLNEDIGNKRGMAMSYNNIGSIYDDQKKYPEALNYHFSSLKIREEIEDKNGLVANYINLGNIHIKLKKITDSKKYLEKALALSIEIGSKQEVKTCYSSISTLDSVQGHWKKAYEHHKLFILYRDSVDNEETKEKTIQTSMNYEFEKKEALTKAEQDKKDSLASIEMKKQQVIRYAVSGILVLVILFTLFLYNRFRLIRKQKNIIELKEKETQLQKHVIEEKHKEITDSINYAERIQRSFLASTEMLDKNLNSSLLGTTQSQAMHQIASIPADACNDDSNYFVFFKPKDVVSGDFYWAGELNNGNFALSCADSTGHGVPGAIMSILNISSLEKSIEQETEPHIILNTTRKIIIERLKKDGSVEGGKDGMDCSLLVINRDKTQLSFAAANNPVFIVRAVTSSTNEVDVSKSNAFELIEFKADKMPVGKHDKDNLSFTLQTVTLQKGDIIYTLTDGFPDQFGGEKGKKYMIKNLKALLLQIAHLSMKEQEQKLAQEFINWKGDSEQVDDVCVIGIKI